MKLAACFCPADRQPLAIVRRMAEAQRLFPDQEIRTFSVEGGAIACVTAGERFSAVQLVRQAANGNLLAIAGVPISHEGGLNRRIGALLDLDSHQAAKRLSELDGHFVAFLWCAKEATLIIVTSFLCVQPLYMHRRDGILLLATELKALPASGLMEIRMDPAGWGAFLTCGHLLSENTMLEGARRVSPACIITYHPRKDSLQEKVYWRWPQGRRVDSLDQVNTADIVELLTLDVRAFCEHFRGGEVLLSGGFDSRLILALLAREGLPLRALILRHADEYDDADGRFGARIARQLCAQFRVVSPSRSFFSSPDYLLYAAMTDVATASLFLYIAQLWPHISPESRAVWEGLMVGSSMKDGNHSPESFREFETTFCKAWDSPVWQAAEGVFAPSLARRMYDAFRETYAREKARFPDDDVGIVQFMTYTYRRTRIALNPMAVYSNRVLTFTPGVSRALWEIVGPYSHGVRAHARLAIEVFQRHFPELCRTPLVSGRKDRLFFANPWLERTTYLSALRRLVGKRVAARLGNLSLSMSGSIFLDRFVAECPEDHPDLNPEFVRDLKSAVPPFSGVYRQARQILLYWSLWRRVMESRLMLA